MERGLVKIAGRAEIPGRPLLYETTQFFLDHFGLRNLDELPNVEELRKCNLSVARVVAPPESPESTKAGTTGYGLSSLWSLHFVVEPQHSLILSTSCETCRTYRSL